MRKLRTVAGGLTNVTNRGLCFRSRSLRYGSEGANCEPSDGTDAEQLGDVGQKGWAAPNVGPPSFVLSGSDAESGQYWPAEGG
jgi:hypothetical protein